MFFTDATIAFFTGVLFILVPLALRERLDHANGRADYRALHSLLTPAELTFYLALARAVGDNYLVLPKISLASLTRPSRRLNDNARQMAKARLRHEQVDFVLCRRETLAVWCVIELDDGASHSYRTHVLDAAEIPVVGFASRLAYDPPEIRARIHDALKSAWRREQMSQEHPLPLGSVV